MATQLTTDDRLDNLEREVAQLTQIATLNAEVSQSLLRAVSHGFERIDERFDRMDERIDRLEAKTDERFDRLEAKLDNLQEAWDATRT